MHLNVILTSIATASHLPVGRSTQVMFTSKYVFPSFYHTKKHSVTPSEDIFVLMVVLLLKDKCRNLADLVEVYSGIHLRSLGLTDFHLTPSNLDSILTFKVTMNQLFHSLNSNFQVLKERDSHNCKCRNSFLQAFSKDMHLFHTSKTPHQHHLQFHTISSKISHYIKLKTWKNNVPKTTSSLRMYPNHLPSFMIAIKSFLYAKIILRVYFSYHTDTPSSKLLLQT
jgi:hypothetical protein